MSQKTLQQTIGRISMYLFIVVAGLMLMFFSNPNRLAHDQIDHKIYQKKYLQKDLFQNDYIMGSPKLYLMDNRFSFKILAYITEFTKSDEITRWVLLPVIFIVFTIGFFELLLFLTKNIAISLIVSFAANFHVPHVFTAEWGLTGPSELDPWTFYQMVLPLLFLGIFIAIKNKSRMLFLAMMILAGILGNLHIITAFNFIGASLIAYLIANKINLKNIAFLVTCGVLSALASFPYLLTHYAPRINHIVKFDPSNSEAWSAIKIIANHTTIEGRILNIRVWLIDYWYTILPFLIICFIYLYNKRRKKIKYSSFDIFSFQFTLGILLFNGLFSLMQVFRLYALNELPFWNEPRGLQFIYLIFFSYLGLFLRDVWNAIKPWFTFSRSVQTIIGMVLISGAIFWRIQPVLSSQYLKHIRPRYSYFTCDSQIYRTLNSMQLPFDSIIMQEPDYWSAFRICTNLSSVVQNRDKALAYSFGSDMMLAWYYRYQNVSHAFSTGGTKLVETARKYHASVIVSRYCAPLPESEIFRHTIVANEGCIDILNSPIDSTPL